MNMKKPHSLISNEEFYAGRCFLKNVALLVSNYPYPISVLMIEYFGISITKKSTLKYSTYFFSNCN